MNRWDDTILVQFEREFQQMVNAIEDEALREEVGVSQEGSASDGLVKLVQGRMKAMYNRLVKVVGRDQAEAALASLRELSESEKEAYGTPKRSS